MGDLVVPRTWMRLGWMRLRCPTSARHRCCRAQSLVAQPAFSADPGESELVAIVVIQLRDADLQHEAANGDVLMQRARIGGRSESFSRSSAVAQASVRVGQDAQVLLGRLFRHQNSRKTD